MSDLQVMQVGKNRVYLTVPVLEGMAAARVSIPKKENPYSQKSTLRDRANFNGWNTGYRVQIKLMSLDDYNSDS